MFHQTMHFALQKRSTAERWGLPDFHRKNLKDVYFLFMSLGILERLYLRFEIYYIQLAKCKLHV